MQNKSFAGLFIAVIVAIAVVFAVAGYVMKRPTESLTEKRKLASFPKLTADGIMDGSFFKGVETWYTDTYPLREPMIATNADITAFYGMNDEEIVVNDNTRKNDKIPKTKHVKAAKTMEIPTKKKTTSDGTTKKENKTATKIDKTAKDGSVKAVPEKVGSIYIAGGRGFSVYGFSQTAVDSYASMVNTVADHMGPSHNVYVMPTPDNFGVILPKSTQERLSQYEGDAFDYIYKRFSDQVNVVQVYNELVNHNSEYIYFRTDHHWTARGAYYAYRQFCTMKGFTPHELKDYEKQERSGFLGSFYSYSRKSPALARNPDTVTAYKPIATNEMMMTTHAGKTMKYMLIQPGNTYSVFIAGDEPWVEIDNPKKNDGSAIVVIKDSYGDAFVPFLVDHYDKVYVTDFRYFTGDLYQRIQDKGIKDIMITNNIEFLSKGNAEKILSMFHFENH